MTTSIPTEPIGSIPRPAVLVAAMGAVAAGRMSQREFETLGDGHTRRLPRLTAGPFRYTTHADAYLRAAQRHARVPVKQAVISASALSLLYPEAGIAGYAHDAFMNDLLREHEADIRGCLDAGAHKVQVDFTEGRLSLKLDPTGGLLRSF